MAQSGKNARPADHECTPRLRSIAVFVLALHLSLILTYVHMRYIDVPTLDSKIEQHHEFLSGDAPNPYQYRVLLHWVTEGVLRGTAGVFGYERAFLLSQIGIILGTTLFSLFLFERYLLVWFKESAALGGMLLFAAIQPLTYFNFHYQPSSSPAMLIFIIGCSLLRSGRLFWYGVLVFISSLNRLDTTIFLVLLYGVTAYRRSDLRFWRTVVLYLILWGCVLMALRLTLGFNPLVHPLSFHASYNLTTRGTLLVVLFYGPLWVWAVWGLAGAPAFLRRSMLLVPPYVVLYFFAAKVNEVRLFLPLAPILMPPALGYLFGWSSSPGNAMSNQSADPEAAPTAE